MKLELKLEDQWDRGFAFGVAQEIGIDTNKNLMYPFANADDDTANLCVIFCTEYQWIRIEQALKQRDISINSVSFDAQ